MTPTMRAKMKVASVTKYQGCELLKLSAVCKSSAYPEDGSDEDNTFAKFSPSAELNITIANPALLGKFEPGQCFYVDFTAVEG
jgi:hypothetical protein